MASRSFPAGLSHADHGRSDDARLADLSPDLLAVVAFDGTVRRANRAWTDVLPWTEEGFDLEGFRSRVHPDDLLAFEEHQQTVLGGGALCAVLIRVHDGVSGYRDLEWTAQPDAPAGIFTLRGRDITDHRRMAQELELRAARLERTNADLQEFAYVASHDLSEPLRMVTSYLDLVRRRYDERLDDTGREFIHYAVDGAQRMRALIDDLLIYSRVGAAEVRRDPVDLDEVMAAVSHDLAAAMEDAGAEVRCGDLGIVHGDATQLGQLLQNLVANAVKFRGERAPVVDVTCETVGEEHVLRVRDNGIGIDPKHAERIFQVFTRLHAREEYAGTGIGLSICRRIAERHGGTIGVESVPGEGTTFVVRLPVESSDEATS